MTDFPYSLKDSNLTEKGSPPINKTLATLFLLAAVLAQSCRTSNPTTGPSRNSNRVTSSNMDGGTISSQSPSPSSSSECDPNYSGCVPIASDVDCAGGKGNGPAYVKGPVRVIGTDIYGLDRDGDGIGCE